MDDASLVCETNVVNDGQEPNKAELRASSSLVYRT